MNRNSLPLAAALAGLFSLAATLPATAGVVATVNGEAIHDKDIDTYIATHELDPQQAQNREAIVNELISRELVAQDARRRGLDEDPQVQARIEQMRRQILLGAAVEQAVEEKPISEEELRAEYEKRLPQLQQPEFRARHILLAQREEAEEMIRRLDDGASFSELAKEHSTGPSGKEGGDLGWFNPNQMVPPFAEAVGQMQEGAYSREPVETQFGWHVIKLEGKRTGEAPRFETLRDQIANVIRQRRIARYLEQLRSDADIDIK